MFGFVALLDADSPYILIWRDMLDPMFSVGVPAENCEQIYVPRSWGGIVASTP